MLAAPAMPHAASVRLRRNFNTVRPCFGYTVVKFWLSFFKSSRVQGSALRIERLRRHNKTVRPCFGYTVVKFCPRFSSARLRDGGSLARRAGKGFGAKPRKNLMGCPNRKRFDAAPCETNKFRFAWNRTADFNFRRTLRNLRN